MGLEIQTIGLFTWRNGVRQIEYTPYESFSPQRLQFWVLHTLLPIIFSLDHSFEILHVGCVEVEGRPFAFSADSFGGKSTLTDYFIRQGHVLLSDDSLGIQKHEGAYLAVPSYPFHRPYREPEVLGYRAERVCDRPKPLHGIYRLEKSVADASITITELKGIEKYKAFHYSNLVDFDFLKRQRFEVFTDMAKTVPVYDVTVPWDLERLPEVYKEIVAHSGLHS